MNCFFEAQEEEEEEETVRGRRLIVLGAALGLFFWIADSILEALVIQKNTLTMQFLHPTTSELWHRSSSLLLFVLFGIYGQRLLGRLRRAEEESAHREKYFRSLLENLHEDIFVIDRHYSVVDVNRNVLHTLGRSRDEILGRPCYEISHGFEEPCDRKGEDCRLQEAFRSGEVQVCRHLHRRGNGSETWVDLIFSPLRDETGEVRYVIEAARDVSHLIQATEEARASETRFQAIFQYANDAIFIHDLSGRFLEVNRVACERLGYSREDLLKMTVSQIDAPEFAALLPERFEKLRKRGRVTCESAHLTSDGRRIPVEVSARLVDLSGEKIVLSIVRDITERKRAEESLKRRTAYFAGIFQGSPDAVALLDRHGRIEDVNGRFEEFFGYPKDEILGKELDAFIAPDELRDESRENTLRTLAGEVVRMESTRLRRDGSTVEVAITGYPIRIGREIVGYYAIYQDITDRKRLEQQFLQAQKMEAVGRLAGGVAHDINNALTSVLGHADLILASVGPEDPVHESAREIKGAAQRASSITRQLLAFSRKQVIQPRVVDLNSLILEMEKMLRRLIGEDIDLVTSLAPDLGRVEVDPGQMDQVILNLAVNARDAMPRGGEADSRDGQCGAGRGVWSPSRGEGEVGALRVSCSDGHWGRDGSGCAVQDLRSFLHHQGGGDGVGSFDGLWDRQAERGLHLGLQRAGARQHIQNLFAEGG